MIVLGFNETSTLWVILCYFPEKGRIEEIVEEMKELNRGERKMNATWEKGPQVDHISGNEGPDHTANAQSDQGLHCPLKQSLNAVDYIDK